MSSFGYDSKRLKQVKPSCALVDTDTTLGSGFLIGEGQLLTCDHVVRNAERALCRFGDDRSTLLEFRVVARFPELDSAVLVAADPTSLSSVMAPKVAAGLGDADQWWAWGFPAVVDGQGVPFWGQVLDEDSVGPDGRHSIQLFAENLVGSGAQLGGYSGSPVLIGEQVVAMIYRVLAAASDGNQARFGMVYAIPISPSHPALHATSGEKPGPTAPPPPAATPEEWEQLRLFETLRRASSPGSILKVFSEWKGLPGVSMPGNVPHLAAERLLGMGAPEPALNILAASPNHTRVVELSALAHSLLGEHDTARGLLATQKPSVEGAGIAGGIFKRRYFQTGQRAWLQGSFQEYDGVHQAVPDSYLAINAAATALWLGNRDLSRERASEARALLEQKQEDKLSHWEWATLGEASLLAGDIDAALCGYEQAVAREPSHGRDIAVMRRQVRRHIKALDISAERFEAVLTVGGVACFTGHRVDEPGRKEARFPRECVARVAARIRSALDEANIRFGFSSAAGGADILFIEQLLQRGGEPTIYLPFPKTDFLATSVGPEWEERFNAVIQRPESTVHYLEPSKPSDPALENAAYARCNTRIRAAAIDAGRLYDEAPLLIAVLRRTAGSDEKVGGTADAVRQWEEQLNGRVVLIDPLG